MAALPVSEQMVIHVLKALTHGEILEDPYPIGCDPAVPGRDPRGVPEGVEAAADETPIPAFLDGESRDSESG